jgi:hypothetical protein
MDTKIEISKFLSIIRYYGFNLKPFSLGIAADYIIKRSISSQFYLHENERELMAFFNMVIDENEIEGAFLKEKNPLAFQIALNILCNETISNEFLIENCPEAHRFLQAIRSKNCDSLNKNVPAAYLKRVLFDDETAKENLKKHNLYSSAFVESLIYKNEEAIQLFLGGMKITA